MKSLNEINKLKEENDALKEAVTEIGYELSDEQLEVVIGGMSEGKYQLYIIDLINEYRHSIIKS
jgi:sugar-specific transcriptional regulator TrmB